MNWNLKLIEMEKEIQRLEAVIDYRTIRYKRLLTQANARIGELEGALEPGKASAIVDGLHRAAEAQGYSSYSSRSPLTFLIERITKLEASITQSLQELSVGHVNSASSTLQSALADSASAPTEARPEQCKHQWVGTAAGSMYCELCKTPVAIPFITDPAVAKEERSGE